MEIVSELGAAQDWVRWDSNMTVSQCPETDVLCLSMVNIGQYTYCWILLSSLTVIITNSTTVLLIIRPRYASRQTNWKVYGGGIEMVPLAGGNNDNFCFFFVALFCQRETALMIMFAMYQ